MRKKYCLCWGVYFGILLLTPVFATASVESRMSSSTSMPTQELPDIRALVTSQGQEIAALKATLESYKKKSEGNETSLLAALGGIFAAVIAGFFAFRNQNEQARQGRLLKAVEIIMDSRSGFQADIRKKNLSVFLDGETKKHLETINEQFAGDEFTDLHVALAESMSEKATSPEEVLRIWQVVLKGKKFFDRVEYPAKTGP